VWRRNKCLPLQTLFSTFFEALNPSSWIMFSVQLTACVRRWQIQLLLVSKVGYAQGGGGGAWEREREWRIGGRGTHRDKGTQ